jgi:predicted peptidase
MTVRDRRWFLGSALGAGTALALPARAAPSAPERDEFAGAQKGVAGALRYLIWVPASAERPVAGWPLMIFLHGSGERGRELARVTWNGPPKYAAAGRQFPFVLVAPQIDERAVWHSNAIEALRADLVRHLPIDADHVVLTGLSLGGHGTWNYAVDHPRRLAAIAPVCGASNPRRAARLAALPVWAFHGARDDVVPLAGDQAMVQAVRAAGGRVKFTVYPEIGHNAWDPAYADPALYDWLLAQRRGRPARD